MSAPTSYSHQLTVRYYEVDSQGIVFNMWYLGYADVALAGYFASVGLTFDRFIELDLDIHVVKSEVTYRAPLRLDDTVDISVRDVTIGRTSLTFDLVFHLDGEPTTEVRIVYVAHRPSDGKKIEVPSSVRTALGAATDF
ncbi:acyl-CoA thioesterase [Gordonia soli]|uniref:Thioesterase domain-containing protein n=1 Tax=Gordonia soli NBRC 108243 TaxID=1223545 RepID=M0QS06_9ACTN|nr:thioesterase family protein [Gordonia soli]GAC70612.1 hypothetical protein GS4_38_00170 [Gordonia soli NBRC 108243]